jgi:hypothetical protein
MGTPGLRPAVALHTARPTRPRSTFYLWITSAMTCTMFLGFSLTYFGPIARGVYPDVSPIVHVHGWSFFAWYLLLPLQAGLIRARKVSFHRSLGVASVGLGALMIVVGFIVSVVQIDRARALDGDPFWQFMGVPIFGTWLLFTGLYVAAMRRRRKIDHHRRLIILASAVPLSAATFRIVVHVTGFSPVSAIGGMLVCLIFPALGILHDRRGQGASHPVYAWGVPAIVLVICASFLPGVVPGGDVIVQALGWLGRLVRPLYLDAGG